MTFPFPFDLTAIAPKISELDEKSTFILQVRATDTGGNTALSNTLSFQLLPDEFGPIIENISPGEGVIFTTGLETVEISFSEPLAADTVNNQTFKLLDSEGELVPASNIQLRGLDRLVQLTFSPLPQSDYQLVIDGPSVTDRAGNALSEFELVSSFTLQDVELTLATSVEGH